MKTKTTKLIAGLALAGCFMIAQQATAQTWGGIAGANDDAWVINKDNSHSWSYLRLQVSNTRAWNMINQGEGNEYGSLWWGYATNSNHNDRGFEAMRLYNDGDLRLANRLISGTTPNGFLPAYLDWNDTRGLLVRSGDDNAFFGLVNRVGENGGDDNFNAAIYFGDNSDDDLVFQTYSNGEIMRLTGDGKLGIGTTAPAEKLHISGGKIRLEGSSQTYLSVNDTGSNAESRFWTHTNGKLYIQNSNGIYFGGINNSPQYARFLSNGNLGIGTNSPSDKLTVYDGEITLQTNDNAEDQGMLFQNSTGNYTWRMYRTDAENSYADLKFASGLDADFDNLQDRMTLKNTGEVGIGTTSPTEKLEVNGTVKATSFTSSAASFPDYVFAETYKITPLSELETYVKANRRLPNMPSEKEVVENGLHLPEVVTKSVENIETIYLHLIRMEKEIKALKQENAALKQQLKQGR